MNGKPGLFERYLGVRRTLEAAFWIAVFALQAGFNSVTTLDDLARAGIRHEPWQPVVWEYSSNLVLLVLVPALVAFERRFPLRTDTMPRSLWIHAAASVVFSLLHVAAMVALREAAYGSFGARYDFGDWPVRWFFEYLKDVRTYVLMLGAILVYRFVMLRLQGEARLLDAPEDGPAGEPVERPQRFLVKKLRKEFLVAANDIEWLLAQGNYVALHVRGHDYLLRSTMAAIETRLDPARFARVHRSYVVNLDLVAEIEPLDSGDARIVLKDGTRLPCSRTYRNALRRKTEST